MTEIKLETEQPYLVQFANTVRSVFTECEMIQAKYGYVSVRLIVKELHVTPEKAAKMLNRYRSIQEAKLMHMRLGNES